MFTRSPRLTAVAVALATTGAVATVPAVASAGSFHTPTGNIRCSTGSRAVVCTMGSPRVSVRLNAYGGRAKRTYRSASYGYKTLRYGHSLSNGRMRCTSRQSGLRCVSRITGHGFMLAKQGSYVW